MEGLMNIDFSSIKENGMDVNTHESPSPNNKKANHLKDFKKVSTSVSPRARRGKYKSSTSKLLWVQAWSLT